MFEEQWNQLPVPTRVQLSLRASLEGKVGSQEWKEIDNTDREKLVTTIHMLALGYQRRIKATSRKLHCSVEYLEQTNQPWIKTGRKPTADEFTDWARQQHPKCCKHYQAAWPLASYNGQCDNFIQFGKCCTSFFANTGICETGYFHPERIKIKKWIDFQRLYRKAHRSVEKKLGEVKR